MLVRLSGWCYRRRRIVAGAWVAIVIGVSMLSGALGSDFGNELEVPDSETKNGFEALDDYFGGIGSGISGQIVFRADQGVADPEVTAAMEGLFAEIDAIDRVTITSPYATAGAQQVVAEGEFAGQVAFARVDFQSDVQEAEAADVGETIRDEAPRIDGLTVFAGGESLEGFEPPESETIGLGFAIVILIVAFGSVLAMGLPLGVAVVGVGTGLGLTSLMSNVLAMPDFATTIGAMIGLGVGIDYALFIVTRYREARHNGRPEDEALLVAMDTAGRAVVFAGVTVVVSLLGLLIIGLQFITGLGIAASTTVLCTMAASVTLLPALIGFAGDRLEVTRWRGLIASGIVAVTLVGIGLGILGSSQALLGLGLAIAVMLASRLVPVLAQPLAPRKQKTLRETTGYRFSRMVQHRPWTSVAIGAGVLLILALPVLDIRLGFSDEGNFDESTDARQAYDLVAEAFGPGFNGPLIVTAELGEGQAPADLVPLVEALDADPGVAAAQGPLPNDFEDPVAAIIQVTPESAPQDAETEDTVNRLRTEVIPEVVGDTGTEVNITGFTAAGVDFSNYLAGRTALFFGAVLALSFLLLMAVFRSLLVPLKAVINNNLSKAAAYGGVVALLQWGWMADLVGIGQGGPIEPFIPMMMFAIVFGLSMDYEVFLLSRIKEEYERTGDPVESVADGLAATARVITAAAAIMVVVFGSFVLEDNRIIKLFGTGLATAVFLDATLVRMLLVPATMELLGRRNWWLPGWLDRIIPNVQVEGHLAEELDARVDPTGSGKDDIDPDATSERAPELV
jgi:RND superfamily putative drug exporter